MKRTTSLLAFAALIFVAQTTVFVLLYNVLRLDHLVAFVLATVVAGLVAGVGAYKDVGGKKQ